MSKIHNSDLIKAVVDEMPAEHSAHLKTATGETITDGPQLLQVLESYPTTKNNFIDTLVNKVGKTLVFSKTYDNPLSALKKGKLEYGDSIEELFVDMAQMKNFGEHWGSSTTTEGDLIRELKPVVNALYIKKNFDKKFKQTIKDKDLRKAFFSSTGLSTLVQRIAAALATSINYNEYKYTRDTLNKFISAQQVLTDTPNGSGDTYEAVPATLVKQDFHSVEVTGTTKEEQGKNLTEAIRATAGAMQFMTDKYNLAKVTTFSNPGDLRLYITPAMQALQDVHVLASAFNISPATINTKVILIDELPGGIGGATPVTGEVLAILADQDLLQIWSTYESMGTFNNPEQQYTNYFASKEGIFSVCLFANVAVFYKA